MVPNGLTQGRIIGETEIAAKPDNGSRQESVPSLGRGMQTVLTRWLVGDTMQGAIV